MTNIGPSPSWLTHKRLMFVICDGRKLHVLHYEGDRFYICCPKDNHVVVAFDFFNYRYRLMQNEAFQGHLLLMFQNEVLGVVPRVEGP